MRSNLWDCHAAPHCGTLAHRVEPALDVWHLIPRQCVQLEAGNPRIRGNIGDRVLVTREVGRVCEVAVEHPVKAVCLFRVALQTVSLLGGVASKRSEEHTSELKSIMRISYAVFCLKKKK